MPLTWDRLGLLALSVALSTVCSIMPQKRNPEGAELVRAKTGRIVAALNGLAMVMKGLPLAYSKDMQEDKEATFDAIDTLVLMLVAMTGMVSDATVHERAMRNSAAEGHSTATDLADWLVRELGLTFRDAHAITGQIVVAADQAGMPLWRLPLEKMQDVEPRITEGVFEVLSVPKSVKSRTSYGGTAPQNVRKMARKWIKRLERETTSR